MVGNLNEAYVRFRRETFASVKLGETTIASPGRGNLILVFSPLLSNVKVSVETAGGR